MKRTLSLWTLMTFLAAMLITSCGPATPVDEPAQDDTVNLVEQAGLDQTIAIEIAVLTTGAADESDAEASGYFSQLTITDPELVDQIVSTLDTALDLGPRARCPNGYELHFHLEDSTVQTFGHACGQDGPAFLRGGQDFWEGQQVTPPDQFNALIQAQLASASEAGAAPIPDPIFTRDAALAYLAQTYGAQALGFVLPQNHLHPAFSHLNEELVSRGEGTASKDENGFRLNIANAIGGQEGYQFLTEFLDILDANYGAGMRPLDFASDPEQARLIINEWASDET